jgi:hypothetical protein
VQIPNPKSSTKCIEKDSEKKGNVRLSAALNGGETEKEKSNDYI